MHLIAIGVQQWLAEKGYDARLSREGSHGVVSVYPVGLPPVDFCFTGDRVYSDPDPRTVACNTNPVIWAMQHQFLTGNNLLADKPVCEFSADFSRPDLFDLVLSYIDYHSEP